MELKYSIAHDSCSVRRSRITVRYVIPFSPTSLVAFAKKLEDETNFRLTLAPISVSTPNGERTITAGVQGVILRSVIKK